MKPLSEALLDLSDRVKRLHDSVANTRDKNHARLRARCEELEVWIDQEVKEVAQSAAESPGAVRSQWSDTKAALQRQFGVMRTDFTKWRAQLAEKDAEQAAQDAEHDAVAAITLASHCIGAAEWAVVRAELIRADADEEGRATGRG